jgi:RNA polymerase sigma-70 factor (ECF subfamily)
MILIKIWIPNEINLVILGLAVVWRWRKLELKTEIVNKDEQYERFERLLVENERAVRRFARSLLPTAVELDDLMQEVGLVCWKKFPSFQALDEAEDSQAFLRWACVIARFEVMRLKRNKARDRLVLSEEVVSILAADAESRLVRAEEEHRALEKCIAVLADDERRLLFSVHSRGDSITRIAGELGLKSRRLYSQLNRLRTQLAACVKKKVETVE